jgi:hypothetical protein
MARLQNAGIEVDLPSGWEGRIRTLEPSSTIGADAPATAGAAESTSVLHAADFVLPTEMGEFGSGAVEVMGPSNVLIALVEYDRASATTALFRRQVGIPVLRVDMFDPNQLQRPLPGQSGTQVFLTVAGRAFCLYVVVGSHLLRFRAVPRVNQVIRSIRISE